MRSGAPGGRDSRRHTRRDLTNEPLAAVVAADSEKKKAALAVLRGIEPERSSDRGKLPEPYMGLEDVAEFLGVSPRSVWRWRVPGHKLGSRTQFRLSEVAAYLESEEFRARMEELRVQRTEDGGHPRGRRDAGLVLLVEVAAVVSSPPECSHAGHASP